MSLACGLGSMAAERLHCITILHFDLLGRHDRYISNQPCRNKVVWSQSCVIGSGPANRCPAPLYLTATIRAVIAYLEITRVRSWVPKCLRIVHRVQTQRQLRLIGFPTLGADQDIHVLGLDHYRLQLAQFVLKPTPVAHRNSVFATCKPVRH
jgi:hypothetical protein